MKPVRLLLNVFVSFFGPNRAQRSIHIILNPLTNRNIALIYSVTICEQQQQEKLRIVHGQGASNITYSTIVFNFDVCRLS